MGLLHVCRLLLRYETTRRLRLFALINVVGCCYFVMMMCISMYMGLWIVVPVAFDNSPRVCFYHELWIVYLFINVVGNYLNAYNADSSVNTLQNRQYSANKTVHAKQKTFHCKKCVRSVPERCHHCAICNSCILKRDHHCFFMAQCIGYHNQKYFAVFCLYMVISGLYATVMLAVYMNLEFGISFDHVYSMLTLLSRTLTAWLTAAPLTTGGQKVTAYLWFLVGLFYACLGAGLAAAGFLCWQLSLIAHGQTTYEARRGITRFGRSLSDNVRDVFGRHWVLAWFLPLRVPPEGDGTYLDTAETALRLNGNEHSSSKQKRVFRRR